MIDTIRFKIKLTVFQQDKIKSKSVQVSKVDNQTSTLKYRIYNTDLILGSYDRNINIFLNESFNNYCFLEFSLPKFYFGHNVFLINLEQTYNVLFNLQHDLEKFFGDFPTFDTWEITRLDLCYSWRFMSQDVAEKILEIIRSYKFSKKKVSNYETSIMMKGSAYSIKWYLKKPEFYYHDYRELVRAGREEYAYNTSMIADGVLRFEVTMRHAQLKFVLNKDIITIKDVTEDFCISELQKYFKKFFKGENLSFMTSQTVLNKLLNRYPNRKALLLYEFYLTFHGLTTFEQKKYLEIKNKKTVWRLQKQLRDAGVGIPTSDSSLDLDFSIPSPYAVLPTSQP